MNNEVEFQVQAFLDNELSEAETKRVANLLAIDQEANRLFTELKETKKLLAGNELPVKLPESGDFYWSKIARAIEQSEREPAPATHVTPWWIRVLAPIAGVACLALLLVSSGTIGGNGRNAYIHEIDTADADAGSGISFHSQSQGMTVVWVSATTDVDVDDQ